MELNNRHILSVYLINFNLFIVNILKLSYNILLIKNPHSNAKGLIHGFLTWVYIICNLK